MTDPKFILKKHFTHHGIALDLANLPITLKAMDEYAEQSVDEYRASESKAINKEAVKLLPSLVNGNLKLWIRNFYFKRACKHAKSIAQIENRKVYVIRCSDVNYTILSTKDVELNKKTRVLGKHVGAKELTETADFIAYPGGVIKSEYVRKLK